MARARTWMGMALWAALAVVLASASGCAVSNSEGLTQNGKFWSKAGKFTDRLTATEPYMSPDAYLVETNLAGGPAAPCPQQATAGATVKPKELLYP